MLDLRVGDVGNGIDAAKGYTVQLAGDENAQLDNKAIKEPSTYASRCQRAIQARCVMSKSRQPVLQRERTVSSMGGMGNSV
jgi:hypothetical protein